MDENDIFSPFGQVVVEHERSAFACERMRQAAGALLPTACQCGQVENRAGVPLGIGPDALDLGGNQGRLARQFQGDLHNLLNIFG